MADNAWWRTFFSGVPVALWLKATSDEQTRAEVDFLERSLGSRPGGERSTCLAAGVAMPWSWPRGASR